MGGERRILMMKNMKNIVEYITAGNINEIDRSSEKNEKYTTEESETDTKKNEGRDRHYLYCVLVTDMSELNV